MAAGLLLTGGASSRMGADKATIHVGGERLADRAARVLGEACTPVVEVGPGYTDLQAVTEEPRGAGPLAALATGGMALRDLGAEGPAVVLAVDMPLVTAELLRFLVSFPGEGTVVPFVGGDPQPVCARYSSEALVLAERAVEGGERSIRRFLGTIPDVQWAGPRMWGGVADERTFGDVDTPEDLRRLGLGSASGGRVEQ